MKKATQFISLALLLLSSVARADFFTLLDAKEYEGKEDLYVLDCTRANGDTDQAEAFCMQGVPNYQAEVLNAAPSESSQETVSNPEETQTSEASVSEEQSTF